MSEISEAQAEIVTSGATAAPKSSGRGILWLVFAAVLWGTVGVSSALLNRIEKTPPLTVGFLRLAFSSPFLLVLAWFVTKANPFNAHWRELPYFGAMGLAMAGYQVFYFFAIPISSVTMVVVIALCSAPLMVALMSIVIFKERLTRLVVAALVLALAGTSLLAFGGGSSGGGGSDYVLGAVLALGAGFSYSCFAICSKLATRHTQATSSQTVALAFTFGALILLPMAAASGNLRLELAPGVWLIAAYMGLVPTGLAYVIFQNALRTATATAASIVTLLEPAVAALLSWLLLAESVSLLTIIGAVMLIGSVWLLSRRG